MLGLAPGVLHHQEFSNSCLLHSLFYSKSNSNQRTWTQEGYEEALIRWRFPRSVWLQRWLSRTLSPSNFEWQRQQKKTKKSSCFEIYQICPISYICSFSASMVECLWLVNCCCGEPLQSLWNEIATPIRQRILQDSYLFKFWDYLMG